MNVTIGNPVRTLALVGVLAVLGLGIAVFNLSRHGSSSSSSSATPATATTHAAATAPTETVAAKPVAKPKPAKPSVHLLPGLPSQVAKALRAHKTAVVTLYAGGGSDPKALAEARAGARDAHAHFLAVNVLKARNAAAIAAFAGGLTEPSTLVVARPGKIVTRLDGVQDRQVVAQAAADAR
jgi:hypothetical protein